MKLNLSKNKSLDFTVDEDEAKEREKILDWSEIDVSKILVRSNSIGEFGEKYKIKKMNNKLTSFVEKISPYVPEYLLQKFMEN